MIKGYRKSASAAKAEGSALHHQSRASGRTARCADFEIVDQFRSGRKFSGSHGIFQKQRRGQAQIGGKQCGPHLCERYQTSAPHRKRERRNLRM